MCIQLRNCPDEVFKLSLSRRLELLVWAISLWRESHFKDSSLGGKNQSIRQAGERNLRHSFVHLLQFSNFARIEDCPHNLAPVAALELVLSAQVKLSLAGDECRVDWTYEDATEVVPRGHQSWCKLASLKVSEFVAKRTIETKTPTVDLAFVCEC